ncbi:MAG: DUF3037 domain-containing protein [Prolixibacteraceae bacterium]|nr:DUF3037 domain-containing protein [Prolixibacteraceae bacterium]
MQQKHQYEYAIVRVVPVVEREEFVNAGVILFCKKEKFIRMKYHLSQDKILSLMPDADMEEIRKNLEAFRIIADGKKEGGPIASLEQAERFRWLSAVRSASIQTSKPHTGLSADLEKTFNTLFDEMVG